MAGGLFGNLANGVRALRDPFDDRLFGAGETVIPGLGRISAENVITATAVFPCVSLLGETIGSLPLEFPRRDGAEDGEAYPWADTLAYQPNPLMTGAEFWATFAFNAVLRGRTYAEPVLVEDGGVELWPLSPVRTVEQHRERRFGVHYTYDDGRTRNFGAGELLTGSGISADGILSVVPWKTAAAAIEMANVLEAFGRNFFKNGARPSGVLSTDQKLSPEALTRLKDEFNGNFAGVLNSGKVPVLEQSLKYLAVTPVNTDNQFLELRRNQIRELARNWRIPLHMLGESDSEKSDEQKAQEFVKYTLRPWLRRIEQAIARDVFTPAQRLVWKPKFNLDALLRGDSATQWRNAVLARTASIASRNWLAENWFGMPRIEEPWADDPREPLNSNRAADTTDGGMTAPQDRSDA